MEKIILHVDMDAFFAAVEVKDNQKLKGKPVIVGGVSERGVVATCSYEARKFGVHSAMPSYIAKAKCPGAIFVKSRFYRYKEVSKDVFEILYSITDKVEAVSIDEAYLDITDLGEDPIKVAFKIKKRVKEEIGLTISVGVSYNKFLAKLSSDWNKPDGLMVISKDMLPRILFDLPISKVHGLGNKSQKKLNNIGIFTIKELYTLKREFLKEYLGKFGEEIYDRIRGIDKREVITTRERKSVGRETTLKRNTKDKEELNKYIEYFSKDIENYLLLRNMQGKTITLKIKTASFKNHTKSKTLPYYISSKEEILKEALNILEELILEEEIRLIGISISSFKKSKIEQLKLF